MFFDNSFTHGMRGPACVCMKITIVDTIVGTIVLILCVVSTVVYTILTQIQRIVVEDSIV